MKEKKIGEIASFAVSFDPAEDYDGEDYGGEPENAGSLPPEGENFGDETGC